MPCPKDQNLKLKHTHSLQGFSEMFSEVEHVRFVHLYAMNKRSTIYCTHGLSAAVSHRWSYSICGAASQCL